ncbi:hypothetical protein JOC86_002419 [Bacillus pakistanensis]|uniref:Uncharacterized protein n=1 Tax=Rossellomorea pakistanensis TaxID=992288 RepID=A0ABS2NDE8_9BACI|nr:hypothetical protein [Bacillus pakistanensis]
MAPLKEDHLGFTINEEVEELLVVVGSLALRLYLSITE